MRDVRSRAIVKSPPERIYAQQLPDDETDHFSHPITHGSKEPITMTPELTREALQHAATDLQTGLLAVADALKTRPDEEDAVRSAIAALVLHRDTVQAELATLRRDLVALRAEDAWRASTASAALDTLKAEIVKATARRDAVLADTVALGAVDRHMEEGDPPPADQRMAAKVRLMRAVNQMAAGAVQFAAGYVAYATAFAEARRTAARDGALDLIGPDRLDRQCIGVLKALGVRTLWAGRGRMVETQETPEAFVARVTADVDRLVR